MHNNEQMTKIKSALRCEKGGANNLRALFSFEKYQTINYDVCRMRRYRPNIFQWNKNDTKSTKTTTRDY